MKAFRLSLMLVAAVAVNAYAFHSGGVAECNGCHTMHTSYEGQAPVGKNGPITSAGPYLLKGESQSSACLQCHSATTRRATGYYVMTYPAPAAGSAPVMYTPGGDFAWLGKTYSWEVRTGTFEESLGERKGHNVVAGDFGLLADGAITNAPGGTYPAASLHCSSCHDPHGKYRRNADGSFTTSGLPIIDSGSYSTSKTPTTWGSVGAYRLLAGVGYEPKSTPGYGFANNPPDAVTQSAYNVPEVFTATDTERMGTINRVAYGRGMSEWCANCHGTFHDAASYASGATGLKHPAGNEEKLDAFIITNYDSYVKTGTITGTNADSYSTLAPFEQGTGDYAALAANVGNIKTGPTADANVSCMSCHRAHATGWDSMLRFPLAADYMTAATVDGTPTYGDPAAAPGTSEVKVAMGRTNAEFAAGMYGRPATVFAPYQRAYCNKCHVKD